MTPKPVRYVVGAAFAAGLVATAACTPDGGSTAPAESPSPSRSPASASPTPSQVQLALGEDASVTLQGRGGESAEVGIAVTDVTRGRIRHLADFRLDAQARRSTPYYATVRITNNGRADLGGRRVTLWGLDSQGTVLPPADVVGTFRRCQNEPLPRRFRRGDSARTCLLYLAPEGTTLDAVQYRFNSNRPPYSWPVP
ncbi:MAG TPA: hypothetical protein VHG70_10190 [Nocardioidaceae bacterium]|nr:hypothetical protein [Nocardioidaceae bacterium]